MLNKPERYSGDYIQNKAGGGYESTQAALTYAAGLKDFYLGQRSELLGDTAVTLLPEEDSLAFPSKVEKVVIEGGLIRTLVDNSPILAAAYAQNHELGDLLYASVMTSGKEVGFDANVIDEGTQLEFGKINGQDGMIRITTLDSKQYVFALYAGWLKDARSKLNPITASEAAPVAPSVVAAAVPPAPSAASVEESVEVPPVEKAEPKKRGRLRNWFKSKKSEPEPEDTVPPEPSAESEPVKEPVDESGSEETPTFEEGLEALKNLGDVKITANPPGEE